MRDLWGYGWGGVILVWVDDEEVIDDGMEDEEDATEEDGEGVEVAIVAGEVDEATGGRDLEYSEVAAEDEDDEEDDVDDTNVVEAIATVAAACACSMLATVGCIFALPGAGVTTVCL